MSTWSFLSGARKQRGRAAATKLPSHLPRERTRRPGFQKFQVKGHAACLRCASYPKHGSREVGLPAMGFQIQTDAVALATRFNTSSTTGAKERRTDQVSGTCSMSVLRAYTFMGSFVTEAQVAERTRCHEKHKSTRKNGHGRAFLLRAQYSDM